MKLCHFSFPMRSLGSFLTVGLLIVGCTSGEHTVTAPSLPEPPETTTTVNPDDRNQYRYLYAVYCTGTVDRLDLIQREKVGSFQLSERSGNPPAVAQLRLPTMRPGVCLACPVITADTQDKAAGVVHIVASDKQDFDSDRRADFSLLTFSLPDWTLQHKRILGNFKLPEPRMLRTTDGLLVLQPSHILNPDGTYSDAPSSNLRYEMYRRITSYSAGNHLMWNRESPSTQVFEWSADHVLFRYGLREPDDTGATSGYGIALADHSNRKIVSLDEFPKKNFPIPPYPYLAPGGRFVLLVMQRLVPDIGVENTGELRLYDADGRLLSTRMEPSIEGQKLTRIGKPPVNEQFSPTIWDVIALTPNGLAIFRNLRGDYQFVDLNQTFGTEPVVNPFTGDPHGTRPGIVYAGQ